MPTMRVPIVAAGLIIALSALAAFAFSPRGSSAGPDQYLFFPGPGDGYLEVADNAALEPQDALTWEAWIYLDDAGSHNGNTSCPSIIGKEYLTSHWVGICSQHIRWYPGAGDSIDSTGTVPLDEWVHIAVTYDEANVNFYINGVLDSTFPFTAALGDNSDTLRFGSDASWPYPPQGAIDEVRLWNVVRSAGDILANMNNTITAPEAGLVGVWNFDAGPEADVGGFGGTLVGDAQIISGDVPTDTPGPTATPGPNVTRLWADATCNDVVDAVDSLALLRSNAGLSVNQEPGCPGIGEVVTPAVIVGEGAGPQGGEPLILKWGDANCDQAIDPIDSLGVLRGNAGLEVNQEPGCPEVGSEIDLES